MQPVRWFDEFTIRSATAALQAEIGQIDGTLKAVGGAPPPKADDTQKMVFGIVAIVVFMLLLLVGALVLFGKRDPQHEFTARSFIMLGLILVGLPVGTYIWAKYFYGVRAQRTQERDSAFRRLADSSEALSFGGFAAVAGSSVGQVPWLATELDVVVECDLYGSFRGHPMAVVECTYVVDMTLSALESSVGKLGAAVMSRVQHEHVKRRMLEAYVFFRSAPGLPDIFWARKNQPLIWYFKKSVGAEPVRQQPDCLMTSDPAGCQQALSPEVEQLFAAKPDCIVQVLGGYVMLIPQTWDWNRPIDMPCQYEQLQENLEWACDLYEALASAAPRDRAEPVPAAANDTRRPAANDTRRPAISPPPPPPLSDSQPLAAGKRPRSVLQLLSALAGFGLIGLGLLIVAAMVAISFKASGAAQWPTVEGRMVVSDVEVDGSRFYPRVEYVYAVNEVEYRGDTLAIGGRQSDRDRAVIEAVIAKYPAASPVTVYYNDRKPSEAVLDPRLAMESIHTWATATGGVIALFGILLVYFGLRRRK